MTPTKRVLVVEDDAATAELILCHLRAEGFELAHAADGEAGLHAFEHGGAWDLLLLDVVLPGLDGLELCRRIRSRPRYTPIIMLSARAGEVHRIVGLELGADDFLAKPFSVFELAARVRALLRRVDALAHNARLDRGGLALRGVQIDPVGREVLVDGRPVGLTPREFELLFFLARHPGKVHTRMQLLNRVWGYRHAGYEHTVNTHINRVRIKIEADPANPTRILTVRGHGYKFAAPETP